MRYFVVLNPASCRGRGASGAEHVGRLLQAARLDFELVQTTAPGHAAELVRENGAQFDVIVVAGGDGTLHEALQTLDLERHALAVLPRGTGNDFAWMNGIPMQLDAAVALLATGHERRVDLGLWAGRRFHNNVGIGFEGRVNLMSQSIRGLRGAPVYLAAVLRTLAAKRSDRLRLVWDGEQWEGNALLVSACIGQRVGGAFRLAPNAVNDDGLFDVCIAGELGLGRILTLLPRTFRGTHIDARGVRMLRCRHLQVSAPEGVPVHIDGEFVAADVEKLELAILPRALRLRTAAASRAT